MIDFDVGLRNLDLIMGVSPDGTFIEDFIRDAVLPLADMSPQRDQEYFCEGMAEEILNALASIQGIAIAPLADDLKADRQSAGAEPRDDDPRRIGLDRVSRERVARAPGASSAT